MAPVDEPVVSLEQALTPYLERAEERKARETVLEVRLAELITADEPADGLARFAERMRDAWVAEIESAPIAPPEVSL